MFCKSSLYNVISGTLLTPPSPLSYMLWICCCKLVAVWIYCIIKMRSLTGLKQNTVIVKEQPVSTLSSDMLVASHFWWTDVWLVMVKAFSCIQGTSIQVTILLVKLELIQMSVCLYTSNFWVGGDPYMFIFGLPCRCPPVGRAVAW